VTFKVQDRQCATCIYQTFDPEHLANLEAAIADPRMDGHFRGYRECHHAQRGSGVCCRGFWNRHRDHFDAGQLAQRLQLVEFVHVDVDQIAERRRKRR
jgi:hypothetical protein